MLTMLVCSEERVRGGRGVGWGWDGLEGPQVWRGEREERRKGGRTESPVTPHTINEQPHRILVHEKHFHTRPTLLDHLANVLLHPKNDVHL